ncbi:hypothetical protein M3Y94_00698900 [Aphelenchoides besseyi]|nr:hypothetical protein M3Y94_00698900 [Aphelenchoides besseyi]KAI6231598.1 hypothetical protein M3Y95_00398800 [Aphelenchoides besseyi]
MSGFDENCSTYYAVIRQALRIHRAFVEAESYAQSEETKKEVQDRIVELRIRELDRLIGEWIVQRRQNGKLITIENTQEVARRIALLLGYENFEANTSWLKAFENRTTQTAVSVSTSVPVNPRSKFAISALLNQYASSTPR